MANVSRGWDRSPLRSAFMVLAAGVLFGTSGTARELGVPGATGPTVGAARMAIGGAALVALAVIRREERAPIRANALVTLTSGIAVAAFQVLFFSAVATTGVALGTLVALGCMPVATGALGRIALGERPGRRWVIATSLAICGCTLLVLPGSAVAVDGTGILYSACAGVAVAVYTICSKRLLMTGLSPIGVMAAAAGIAGLLLLPVLFAGDASWLVSLPGLATALFLGLFTTALAYSLFAAGLRELSSGMTSTLGLVEPLTAAALGVVVLGERLRPAQLLGVIVIMIGLALVSSSDKRVAAAGHA